MTYNGPPPTKSCLMHFCIGCKGNLKYFLSGFCYPPQNRAVGSMSRMYPYWLTPHFKCHKKAKQMFVSKTICAICTTIQYGGIEQLWISLRGNDC